LNGHLFLKADYTSCFLVPFVIKKSSGSVCNPSYNKFIAVSLPKTKKQSPPPPQTAPARRRRYLWFAVPTTIIRKDMTQ